MLKRKIESFLLEWKAKPKKNCLLIKGARQVGKTFIVDKFGKENYKSYIRINFEQNKSLKSIFDGDLDIETLKKQITLNIPTAELINHNTLIFLDEIQACPQARTALKFFAIDGNYDVIASGSLLGIQYNGVPSSYPTGYEDEIIMHSLDFEEYLWANNVSTKAIAEIKEYFDKGLIVPTAINNKMMSYFKEYIVIGGMPAVVDEFIKKSDFNAAYKAQRAIINNYLNDIAKFAPPAEKVKARACFLTIPQQLSKENKKFQYKIVEKKGTARKYEGSLQWLYDAGITCFCKNLSLLEKPLEGYVKEGYFKVYMCDIGLLVAMLEYGSQKDIIDGNLGIYKGAIFENVIASIFIKKSKNLYYFADGNRLEVNFIIRHNGGIAGVEVKAGKGKATSLKLAMEENKGIFGIKLIDGNIGEVDNIITYPIYMAMFL